MFARRALNRITFVSVIRVARKFIMSIHIPTRGGTRGGQDRFEWEDVKVDKDRENYLGETRG